MVPKKAKSGAGTPIPRLIEYSYPARLALVRREDLKLPRLSDKSFFPHAVSGGPLGTDSHSHPTVTDTSSPGVHGSRTENMDFHSHLVEN